MDFNFLPPPSDGNFYVFNGGTARSCFVKQIIASLAKDSVLRSFVRTALSEIMRFETFFGTTANLSSLCHVSADSEEQLPFISDILQMIILLVLPF